MIFFHGHKFINKNGKYYTSGSLNNGVFQRYLHWFGEVTVFANERSATKEHAKLINNNNEVTNVNLDLINTKVNLRNFITVIRKVKKAVYNHDYIVVRMPSFYGILAVRFARKMDKKYLVEVVGCPWDAFWNHSLKGKIIAPFMWIFTRKTLKDAPYAVYVTNEFLQSRYPTKGKSIGCSDVVLPRLEKGTLEKRIEKINLVEKGKPIIIGTTAAVNVRYKGQEYVIKAVSNLNKEGHNFEYHLAGGGDNQYLKSVAKEYGVEDKVFFLGALPHDKVFEYLDNIDIYIQPSKQEGLPRALVEAMSRGCPSLGSNTGGIPELLNKDFIFKNGAVDEICELLKKMDEKMMLSEAKRSFKKAKEFDKEFLDSKRTNFYKGFVDNVKTV
ncbi:glycosyltransferase family 4 protein [Cytobacillus oceanisediminis]|uniref:glycosyltransferase family 4 protein n=1 Tax=Cytobacillus oceanisediminis TaxID=665099 RepID=UPI00207923D2|nr:glycosyltransferase family 4 protein [Cytobacillus oceanisediminis]USK43968.1 glycosyltransferase family 4 protein [Cytobacillus oceanisediminis]